MTLNWMTIIVSVLFSTIIANSIGYLFFKHAINKLDKKTSEYIYEIKNATINYLNKKFK